MRTPAIRIVLAALAVLGLASATAFAAQPGFRLEEATIESTHRAIQSGQITCLGVVQAYINRIKAYNGQCTALVTADGKPIKPVPGRILAGAPVKYPTSTVAASSFIPDLDKYRGLPIEY